MNRKLGQSSRRSGPRPGRRPWSGALLVLTALALLALPRAGQAHGVHAQCRPGRAMVVQVEYDGGDPMNFAKVRIKGPDGKTFQVGNSDAKGRFAWSPDRRGLWKVVVNDGMGHQAEMAVTVSDDSQSQIQSQAQAQAQARDAPSDTKDRIAPQWIRALWGLNLLFFCFGAVFWWKGRRKSKTP